jgi:hypothetical protein
MRVMKGTKAFLRLWDGRMSIMCKVLEYPLREFLLS